jgi:hypothetical protein
LCGAPLPAITSRQYVRVALNTAVFQIFTLPDGVRTAAMRVGIVEIKLFEVIAAHILFKKNVGIFPTGRQSR